jgi:hypothetical protein
MRQMKTSQRATSAVNNLSPKWASTSKPSTCVYSLFLLTPHPFTCTTPHQTSLTKSIILQGIQMALRSSLAHIRAARISPAVLTAPPAGFVPPPQGVGLPFPLPPDVSDHGSSGTGAEGSHSQTKEKARGLLEERVERDAWRGALDALSRLMDARRAAEAAAQLREG